MSSVEDVYSGLGAALTTALGLLVILSLVSDDIREWWTGLSAQSRRAGRAAGGILLVIVGGIVLGLGTHLNSLGAAGQPGAPLVCGGAFAVIAGCAVAGWNALP
jgi:hypothetical protein